VYPAELLLRLLLKTPELLAAAGVSATDAEALAVQVNALLRCVRRESGARAASIVRGGGADSHTEGRVAGGGDGMMRVPRPRCRPLAASVSTRRFLARSASTYFSNDHYCKSSK
jgi:hypothetical protein